MTDHSGFMFSRVVVVESLERHEVKTGAKIADFVKSVSMAQCLGISVEYTACEDVVTFESFVNELAADVKATGRIPLLHVECHGDRSTGLEFENGSQLSWTRLSQLLVGLNEATRFNLVAIFSACYGAHFVAQMGCLAPAPCFAMIAPSEDVYPDEILTGFRLFYADLLRTADAGQAVDAMLHLSLQKGAWFAMRAETWFEKIVTGYVESHCTKSEAKRRALQMYRQLRSSGAEADLGELRRKLVQSNRNELIGKYFECYFMAKTVTETAVRFRRVRRRIDLRLAQYRKTGRYAI